MATSMIPQVQRARIIKNFTIPQYTAGSYGYISFADLGFTGSAKNAFVYTADVVGTAGLQLTPLYATNGNAYVNYYAPASMTREVSASLIVEL